MNWFSEDGEAITITRKDSRDAVLISESAYNNMIENKFVLGNPANLKWLTESANELKAGKARDHDLIEPDN